MVVIQRKLCGTLHRRLRQFFVQFQPRSSIFSTLLIHNREHGPGIRIAFLPAHIKREKRIPLLVARIRKFLYLRENRRGSLTARQPFLRMICGVQKKNMRKRSGLKRSCTQRKLIAVLIPRFRNIIGLGTEYNILTAVCIFKILYHISGFRVQGRENHPDIRAFHPVACRDVPDRPLRDATVCLSKNQDRHALAVALRRNWFPVDRIKRIPRNHRLRGASTAAVSHSAIRQNMFRQKKAQ